MNAKLSELKKQVFIRFILAFIFIGLTLFLPAGTFGFWQAWIYCAVIFIPVIFVLFYFLKKDPALLERRMRMREKEEKQKTIIKIAFILFFIGFIIPGLDYRYHWSDVPFLSSLLQTLSSFLDIYLFSSFSGKIVMPPA